MSPYQSWGRYFKYQASALHSIPWRDEFSWLGVEAPVLAYGLGRSYGDSCLNQGGTLLLTRPMNHLMAWDEDTMILRVEAGVSLHEILDFAIPRGYFLPVMPGTKFVTVGGAIANDIHGKNHHVAGTFGVYVEGFNLLRSNGEQMYCSRDQNPEMYRATIGGLGLTGLISFADIKLKKASSTMEVEYLPFHGLQEFFDLSQNSMQWDYTVAWMDCINAWSPWGRGLFMRGVHSPHVLDQEQKSNLSLEVPVDLPSWLLNRYSCKAFNELYYQVNRRRVGKFLSSYHSYFFPLDAVAHWNRIYGRRGFFQYQCVVPVGEVAAFHEVLEAIAGSGLASFLAVLKYFGAQTSPGMMSFPREGYTLTLDFAYRRGETISLLRRLTDIVNQAGGRLYPAKDSMMTPKDFAQYFPQWQDFATFKDPKFSSSFWRRVTNL